MFGDPLRGPARMFCDNESVVNVASNVESRLRKKTRFCILRENKIIYRCIHDFSILWKYYIQYRRSVDESFAGEQKSQADEGNTKLINMISVIGSIVECISI